MNSTSASQIVTPLDLITEGNVRATLTADKGPKALLITWKIVDFTKKGENYVCVVSSVEIKYELDGQTSEVVYVVKLNSCRDGELTEDINGPAFEKESSFYYNLVPLLNTVLKEIGQRNINFPKCLYVSLEKGKEIIFLEDLRPQGYKMLELRRGMDEAHATLVLRELARLHAASLLLQNKKLGKDLRDDHPCLEKSWYGLTADSKATQLFFQGNLKFTQEILKKVGGYERAADWIGTLIPNIIDVLYEQLQCGYPKVVCHGDCWNNNLLFKYDETGHPKDVMLLDLQVVSYTPPTTDLNYLMYTSMTGDVRKSNVQVFLDCYHETLTNIMEAAGQEAPFTREKLLQDFRDKNLFGVLFGMMFVPFIFLATDQSSDSSKDTDENIETMMQRAREHTIRTLDTNKFLKPRLLLTMDEMMEVGLIP